MEVRNKRIQEVRDREDNKIPSRTHNTAIVVTDSHHLPFLVLGLPRAGPLNSECQVNGGLVGPAELFITDTL